MSTRFVTPFFDAGSGIKPSDGAQLFFTVTGTNDDLDTFSDEALTTANPNPVIADSTGLFPDIFLGPSSVYKVVLKDKNSVQIWEGDPVSATAILTEVDTIALMTALVGVIDGDKIRVHGYTALGDNIVRDYRWDSTSTTTANGGTVFAHDTISPGRFLAEFIDITPKDFGAFGDGTTAGGGNDDTVALQASYDAAGLAGNRWNLTVGNYRFTAQLDLDDEIDVVGTGRNDVILIKDGTFDGILISDSNGAFYSGFAVVGATSNTGIGIDIFHGQRITMSEIRIRDMGASGDATSHGLLMRAGNQAGFYNLKITSNGGDGIRIASGTGEPGQSANAGTYNNLDLNANYNNLNMVEGATNIIEGAICQNAVNKNIQILSPSERNYIRGYNEVEAVTSTLAGTANDVVMMQGEITDTTPNTLNRILEFNAAGLEFPFYVRMFAAQLYIQDRETGGSDSSAWTVTEAADVTNSIINFIDQGSAAKPGILNIAHVSTPAQLVSMTIDGSITAGSNITTAGVMLNSIVTTLTDIAVPVVTSSNLFLMTGSTSITNFTGSVGQTIYIRADSTRSIVHSGTIVLSGGVNFDMVSGDTLTLTQFSTNVWSETGRMVA